MRCHQYSRVAHGVGVDAGRGLHLSITGWCAVVYTMVHPLAYSGGVHYAYHPYAMAPLSHALVCTTPRWRVCLVGHVGAARKTKVPRVVCGGAARSGEVSCCAYASGLQDGCGI